MADSTQTETKAETPRSELLLEDFKTKETCPRCQKKFLSTLAVGHVLKHRRHVEAAQNDTPKSKQTSLPAGSSASSSSQSYRNNFGPFEEVTYSTCAGCGYSLYETEQQRELRKENDKGDKDNNLWVQGATVLLTMLAVILAINLERSGFFDQTPNILPVREDVIEDPQPVESSNGLFR